MLMRKIGHMIIRTCQSLSLSTNTMTCKALYTFAVVECSGFVAYMAVRDPMTFHSCLA